MKKLRCVTLLLGVLGVGSLMGPLYAQAGSPVLVIDGVDISGLLTGPTCSADDAITFTACWALPTSSGPIQIGNFMVSDVAPGNTARLLAADTDGSGGSLDLLRLTGMTFTPVSSSSANLFVTFGYTFNDITPNNVSGIYTYGQALNGFIVPPFTTNVVGADVNTSANGDFGFGPTFLEALDTNTWAGPTSLGIPGSFSLVSIQPFTTANCNNGGGFCTPPMTHSLFVFFPQPGTTLFLTNSAISAGKTCRDTGPPPNVPPGPPSPHPPNIVCKGASGQINHILLKSTNADNRAAQAAGAVPFTPCSGSSCGGSIF